MKWTRVEKHWQELALKANAAQLNAAIKARPELQPGAEREPASDADPQASLVDEQAIEDSGADSTNRGTPADATPGRLPKH